MQGDWKLGYAHFASLFFSGVGIVMEGLSPLPVPGYFNPIQVNYWLSANGEVYSTKHRGFKKLRAHKNRVHVFAGEYGAARGFVYCLESGEFKEM